MEIKLVQQAWGRIRQELGENPRKEQESPRAQAGAVCLGRIRQELGENPQKRARIPPEIKLVQQAWGRIRQELGKIPRKEQESPRDQASAASLGENSPGTGETPQKGARIPQRSS